MTDPTPAWVAWAPPLDPPTAGGLPFDAAEAIANACWDSSPHLCAALQWEAYAFTLPPGLPVANVNTGSQSVSYSPPAQTGAYGAALARAAEHRSYLSGALTSVQLSTGDESLSIGLGWVVSE